MESSGCCGERLVGGENDDYDFDTIRERILAMIMIRSDI